MNENKCCGETMRLVGGTGATKTTCQTDIGGNELVKTAEIMIYQCNRCKKIIID